MSTKYTVQLGTDDPSDYRSLQVTLLTRRDKLLSSFKKFLLWLWSTISVVAVTLGLLSLLAWMDYRDESVNRQENLERNQSCPETGLDTTRFERGPRQVEVERALSTCRTYT